jgi:hypothetical protein
MYSRSSHSSYMKEFDVKTYIDDLVECKMCSLHSFEFPKRLENLWVSTTWDWPVWDDIPSPSPLLPPCLLLTWGRLACLSAHALQVMVSMPPLCLSSLLDISTQHKTMQKINEFFHRDIVSFLTNQHQQFNFVSVISISKLPHCTQNHYDKY